jgi:hypothetical protein
MTVSKDRRHCRWTIVNFDGGYVPNVDVVNAQGTGKTVQPDL